MTTILRSLTCLAACTLIVAPALADPSNINAARKFCWGENIGYLNWRDAGDPAASQGAVIGTQILSGFIWAENVGWITLGDGSPTSLLHYGNTDGADCGVNIDSSNDLFGLAWGENIGWVNFDTRAALSPFGQQARVDRTTKRLRGFAWGENIGWINLNDAGTFVSFTCPADFDANGRWEIDDIFVFLNAWFSSCQGQSASPCNGQNADFDGDGAVSIDDIFVFLNAWFAGC